MKLPLASFAKALHPKERVFSVRVVDGRLHVATEKALYELDDRGRVTNARVAAPSDLIKGESQGRLDGAIALELRECVVLGGSGPPLSVGQCLDLTFDADSLSMKEAAGTEIHFAVSYGEIETLTITGPGSTSSGGGFFGGGFGFEGAAVGIAAATALNALTTTTETTTVVELVYDRGEIFFLYQSEEPWPLRVRLSPVFTKLRLAPYRAVGSGPPAVEPNRASRSPTTRVARGSSSS